MKNNYYCNLLNEVEKCLTARENDKQSFLASIKDELEPDWDEYERVSLGDNECLDKWLERTYKLAVIAKVMG